MGRIWCDDDDEALICAPGFTPLQVSAVTAWLRLAASTITGGEYDTVVDVLNSNPTAQTDADRKPAASTSSNGLPTMTFDGTDVLTWPLAASNNSTVRWGIACWLRISNVSPVQHIYNVMSNNGHATTTRCVLACSSGTVQVAVYTSAFNGRSFTTSGALSANTWAFVRVAYDSTKSAEADLDGLTDDAKVRVFVNEVAQALTAADVGAGGTIGALQNPTGRAVIGAANDADSPVAPLQTASILGPNIYVMNANLASGQGLALMNFEAPN